MYNQCQLFYINTAGVLSSVSRLINDTIGPFSWVNTSPNNSVSHVLNKLRTALMALANNLRGLPNSNAGVLHLYI